MLRTEIAYENLGLPGRLLGSSKSEYKDRHPNDEVFFNACIFYGEDQIWHGDLNLTNDREMLQNLANDLGEITVTPEMPYRFEGRYPKPRKGLTYVPPASEERVVVFKGVIG